MEKRGLVPYLGFLRSRPRLYPQVSRGLWRPCGPQAGPGARRLCGSGTSAPQRQHPRDAGALLDERANQHAYRL
eukprot:7020027-Pyramimonas_sp.AAC.1